VLKNKFTIGYQTYEIKESGFEDKTNHREAFRGNASMPPSQIYTKHSKLLS